MFRRGGDIVDAEKFAHEADIGAAGELHFFRAVMQVELFREGFCERRRARAAGEDERAINVEQNEPGHVAQKIPEVSVRASLLAGGNAFTAGEPCGRKILLQQSTVGAGGKKFKAPTWRGKSAAGWCSYP
jgi:hypothetical protein